MMLGMSTSGISSRRRHRAVPQQLWRARVVRTERVTPKMARITVGGPGLAGFENAGGDTALMLYLYPPGTELPEDFTIEKARVGFATLRPHMRSYTVRRHDADKGEIDFDFVMHAHDGHLATASSWAEQASIGDEMVFVGPSPAHSLNPDADWHLLIGDETALPAISVMLEELPADAVAHAFIEVADPAEQQELVVDCQAAIHWVHRSAGGSLATALAAADFPPGTVDVWAAGEKGAMMDVRAQLVDVRGLDRRTVRPHTYWRA
ncbi:siderophore-interacting protein [Pseudonocardiaceae bacterium YIM PH 21723]|nr:siderophore-interacting protein [Pseudonocardiaceae bacterium YIM PH 21723]